MEEYFIDSNEEELTLHRYKPDNLLLSEIIMKSYPKEDIIHLLLGISKSIKAYHD